MSRFQAVPQGASWRVIDTEILTPQTYWRRQQEPITIRWFSSADEARALADELNRTRGKASDEPKCSICGSQPAGPVGSDHPMCASCHSRLADMHG